MWLPPHSSSISHIAEESSFNRTNEYISTMQDSICGAPDTMPNVLLCVLVSDGGHLRGLLAWYPTGPDRAVVMSSANGLVGTGFASRYRLQPRAGF